MIFLFILAECVVFFSTCVGKHCFYAYSALALFSELEKQILYLGPWLLLFLFIFMWPISIGLIQLAITSFVLMPKHALNFIVGVAFMSLEQRRGSKNSYFTI